ncbi:MAG: bifunctional oligoribonuclease/PAP phosphatase NrnA [Clostridia bacterium]|nr:bifunctional oligoribonuclease/PAP phosphatase NrnA [Clostridia bacterium]
MKISNELVEAINNSNNVAIFIHVRPDGDCIGSGVALKLALEQIGKHADIYCDGEVGKTFSYLKRVDTINKPTLKEYDTAIAVDVPTFNRIGCYADLYKSIKCRLNIDHHQTNDKFGDIDLIDGTRASACEIIYELFVLMNLNITKEISEALYTGIATDTGCFVHNNVQSVTHIIAADLMNRGVDVGKINTIIFKNKSLGQVELQKIALNHMQFYGKNKICFTYLTKGDFTFAHCTPNDTVGLVDTFIGIDGVEIGALISEDKPGICAVSIRSKGNINVSTLAEYFGGGGHKNAAGCNIFGSARVAVKKLAKAVEEVYAGIY